jgi:dynein heavy chain
MFPGLINCTSIDWFFSWPEDALIDVASRFLKEVELPDEETQDALAKHMAFVHLSIDDANQRFKEQQRRNNYTTPTSFLGLISFYKRLLNLKQGKIIEEIGNLQQGLSTMEEVGAQVEGLKKEIEVAMANVAVEVKKTEDLIAVVNKESADAAVEQEKANV